MKQQSLFKPPRRERTPAVTARGYDVGNLASARIIMADPDKYGGETSGLVIWARMAIRRIEGERVSQ